MLLNGATPAELADCCPFVERAYPVSYTDFLGRSAIPRPLLQVCRANGITCSTAGARTSLRSSSSAACGRSDEAAARHFRARIAHGIVGVEPPAYLRDQSLQLELPAKARERADEELGDARVRIAVMPEGSSEPSRYPAIRSWELILQELAAAFPEATFCLVGKLARDGRTTTSIEQGGVERLEGAVSTAVNCFDRPLLEQLAFVEACDVFVSPHTGFGAAVLAVGTPWLAVAGGPWHEWLFNGVPFYSVLPDTTRYRVLLGDGDPPALVDDEARGRRA